MRPDMTAHGHGHGLEISTGGESCVVEVKSYLRLRPLLRKEKEDQVLLSYERDRQNRHSSVVGGRQSAVVATLQPPVLHGLPLSPPGDNRRTRGSGELDATGAGHGPQDFHFNNVLSESTNQDKLYHAIGLPMATKSMESLLTNKRSRRKHSSANQAHVLICMGVASSGKTHACFGASTITKRRSSGDGIVPRMLDSFFSQAKHLSSELRSFGVEITIVQVTQAKKSGPHDCSAHDLLADAASASSGNMKVQTGAIGEAAMRSPSPKKIGVSLLSMASRMEQTARNTPLLSPFKNRYKHLQLDVKDGCTQPTTKIVRDGSDARNVIQAALTLGQNVARAQHNRHIFVTMQPIVNGNRRGEKIAVVDMAGLEKRKRSRNRGKETVHNNSQAGSSAMLHCLRAMMQNTNIHKRKSDTINIECTDDTVSELSCVSQVKEPYQKRLKPVPFRQHEITILLGALVCSTRVTNISLLQAAYPGHADYFEKRSLLQDIELLCGASLLSHNAFASTGLEEQVIPEACDESVSSDDDSVPVQDDNHRYDTVVHNRRRDARSPSVGRRGRSPHRHNPHAMHHQLRSMQKSHKTRSPLAKDGKSGGNRRPASPCHSITLTATESSDCSEDNITRPPPFAPACSAEDPARPTSHIPNKHKHKHKHKHKNDCGRGRGQGSKKSNKMQSVSPRPKLAKSPHQASLMSDFPGVHVPRTTSGVAREMFVEPSMVVGGKRSQPPPSPTDHSNASFADSPERYRNDITHKGQASPDASVGHYGGAEYDGEVEVDDAMAAPPPTAPLPTAPVANMIWRSPMKMLKTLKKSGGRVIAAVKETDIGYGRSTSGPGRATPKIDERRTDKHGDRSPEPIEPRSYRSSPSSYQSDGEESASPHSPRATVADIEDLQRRIMQLESEKQELRDSYDQLQSENEELRKKVKECTRDERRNQRSVDARSEEDHVRFASPKRDRSQKHTKPAASPVLYPEMVSSGPLWDHMQKTQRVYENKNPYFQTDKPHFNLQYPNTFQRAGKLNQRERGTRKQSRSPTRSHRSPSPYVSRGKMKKERSSKTKMAKLSQLAQLSHRQGGVRKSPKYP